VESEEAELEHVSRQTQRHHMVAPPIASAREEDTVLIRPMGDSKYIFDLFSLFDYILDVHYFLFIVFQFLIRHQF
jgi:hypothetical protein